MSNLKKILALVLALVMSMSLVTVASAAYEDQDQVDARYAEAVQVLSDMGIFKGYNGGASFGPKALITREEVATIMYRVISTDLTDAQKGLYVEAAKFSDVANTKWSAGYIGYCYNGNYVKGYEDGTFGPAKNVTGYEVLAMILRAVGYDKNGEFSGSQWKQNIASLAQQLGILNNVAPTVVLSQPATRELVAELIFRTMVEVNKVEYTPFLNYQPVIINVAKDYTTLGLENFGLYRTGRTIMDDWGRPGYYWLWDNNGYSAFPETAATDYDKAVCECQLADDIGLKKVDDTATVWMFDNGSDSDVTVGLNHTAYDELYGGQGTVLEVYPAIAPIDENDVYALEDIVVIVDTYLAKVTDVVEKDVDTLNHVIVPASNTLDVYFGTDCDNAGATVGSIAGNKYAKGEFILVNYNEAEDYYVDLGVAKTIVGKQTINWNHLDKHTINDKNYDDAEHFSLDAAGFDETVDYTWFMDQFNNVIGSAKIINPKTYGTVISVQWINPMDEDGYARATVMYMDGTTAVKTLGKIDTNPFYYCDYEELGVSDFFATGAVCTNKTYNVSTSDHLYQFSEASGILNLTTVLDEVEADMLYGVPTIDEDAGLYVDSNTLYLVRSTDASGKYVFTSVKGYEKFEKNYPDAIIDWALNEDEDEFADYVYVIGNPEAETTTDSKAGDFVMITNKATAKYLKNVNVNYVELLGVYGYKNGTTPVKVTKAALVAEGLIDAQGNDTGLTDWLKDNEGKLFRIRTLNGKVDSWAKVEEVTATDNWGYWKNEGVTASAMFAGYAQTYDVQNNVLVTYNIDGETERLNIVKAGAVVTKNGVGTTADLLKAVKDGTPVYVVGDNLNHDKVNTVFITTEAIAEELTQEFYTVDETTLTTDGTDADFWTKAKANEGAYIFNIKPSNAYVHEDTAAEDVMYFVYKTKVADSTVTLKIDNGDAFVNTNVWTGEAAGETHCFFVQVTANGSAEIRNAGVNGTDGTLAGLGTALTTGYHTYSIVDQAGNVLLQGTFYIA